ncbi:MAG: GNAT family N-acetyltransferase [Candidatus Limnocylindrales bacterium]
MTIRRGTQVADLRPAVAADLPACAAVWHVALAEYLGRLGQPDPVGDVGAITALYDHLLATDPQTFIVATRPDEDAPGGERVVGFVVALRRRDVWFLSMLFVLPEEQGLGLGRALLEAVLPVSGSARARATATDSAQPISNALYSRFGMVPRLPLLHLLGEVHRPERLPDLPDGIRSVPFEEVAAVGAGGSGHRELAETVGRIDREIVGFDHPDDHRFLRLAGRQGRLFIDRAGESIGYGYAASSGQLGPLAVVDPGLVAPALGCLVRSVTPRGAYAVWVPGAAAAAVAALLEAGLRVESFPILLCWDEPIADFARYLPISPGLL